MGAAGRRGRPGHRALTRQSFERAPGVDRQQVRAESLYLRSDAGSGPLPNADKLYLKGERKFGEEVKKEHFQRVERRHGAFSRSFTLPNTVDAGKISASYKDGVLSIRLPQREEAKPKQIAVNVE